MKAVTGSTLVYAILVIMKFVFVPPLLVVLWWARITEPAGKYKQQAAVPTLDNGLAAKKVFALMDKTPVVGCVVFKEMPQYVVPTS